MSYSVSADDGFAMGAVNGEPAETGVGQQGFFGMDISGKIEENFIFPQVIMLPVDFKIQTAGETPEKLQIISGFDPLFPWRVNHKTAGGTNRHDLRYFGMRR